MPKRAHGCINILSLHLSFLVEGFIVYCGWKITRFLAEVTDRTHPIRLGDFCGDPSLADNLSIDLIWLPLVGVVVIFSIFQIYLMIQIGKNPLPDSADRNE